MEFFEYSLKLYNLFDDNKIPIKDKKNIINELLNYFCKRKEKKWLTRDLSFQIETTLNSLLTWLNTNTSPNTSHLSTTIVENFFSIIRKKILYPNLFEYSLVYYKAFIELVKYFSNSEIPYYRKSLSKNKKYNNNKLIFYSKEYMYSLLVKPKNKVQTIKDIAKINKDGDENKVKRCIELSKIYSPERKKMRIRESSCKKNPTEEIPTKGYLLCSECPERSFIYPGALRNHLQRDHDIGNDELEFYMKKSSLLTGGITSLPCVESETNSNDSSVLSESPNLLNTIVPEAETNLNITKESLAEKTVGIVLMDTETTGFNGKLVEIAALDIINKKEFRKLIKPLDSRGEYIESTTEAFQKHKYSKAVLMKADSFDVVGKDLINWVKSFEYEIVLAIFHNKKFDEKIIKEELKSVGLKLPSNWIFGDSIHFGKFINLII